MKKALNVTVCLLITMLMIGCSAFRSSTQPVNFTCEPKEGVVLVVSGKKYTCPVTIEAPRNREMSIEAYKDGYTPYTKTVSYHNNTTFTMLDIIGGCIWGVPLLGLFTAGVKDLDETDIYVRLMPTSNQFIDSKKDKSISSVDQPQNLNLERTTMPAMETERQQKGIRNMRGIVLCNKIIIEGEIVKMNADTIIIRTKEGEVLSYSFEKDVCGFIK